MRKTAAKMVSSKVSLHLATVALRAQNDLLEERLGGPGRIAARRALAKLSRRPVAKGR